MLDRFMRRLLGLSIGVAVLATAAIIVASREPADAEPAQVLKSRLTGEQLAALHTVLPEFDAWVKGRKGDGGRRERLLDYYAVVKVEKDATILVSFGKPGWMGGGMDYVLRPPYDKVDRRYPNK